MTRDEAAGIEQAIAVVVAKLRREHAAALEPLRDRVMALERDLAAFEARAAAPDLAGDNVTWLQRSKRA